LSKFKKVLVYLGTMVLAVVGVTALVATPASASPSCSYPYVCIYQDAGGGGSSVWLYGPNLHGTCYYVGNVGFNDIISSIRNEDYITIKFRDNFDCTGQTVTLAQGQYVNDLGGWPYFFNDRISAIQFY
jgi:hypothetical protein